MKKLFSLLPIVASFTVIFMACAPDEPVIERLPTLTPSPVGQEAGQPVNPAEVQDIGEAVPSVQPTITLTPGNAATIEFGPFPTSETPESVSTAPDPVIEYFVANPTEGAEGDTITLFWATQEGTSAALYRLNSDGQPGTTWEVDLEGEFDVVVRESGRNEVYVLSVSNGIETVEQQVAIQVACDTQWFFEPAPEDGCPNSTAFEQQIRTQQFENGRMFRIGDTEEIVVIFDDVESAVAGGGQAWIAVADNFSEEQLADPGNISAPPGLIAPGGSFGAVWRNVEGVRDRLGWATNDEFEYTSTYQRINVDDTEQLYFTDETGAVITLVPGGRGWLVAGYLD